MDFTTVTQAMRCLGDRFRDMSRGPILSSSLVRRPLYGWEGSLQGKGWSWSREPGRMSVLLGKMLSIQLDVLPSSSDLAWGYGFAGPVILAGEASALSLTQVSRVNISGAPNSNHEWVSQTAADISESPSPPSSAPESESNAANRRCHGWNPPCFHFFIHLMTLGALRILSASLGTTQWLLGVFMPGNDHLVRAEAPSHPRHCLTLKLWEGGGCIVSDQVQSNVIVKSVEKLHKDPDSILFLLYLSSLGTELEVDEHQNQVPGFQPLLWQLLSMWLRLSPWTF